MIVVWRDSAADDLERVLEWLDTIEGANSARVRARINAAIVSLDRLGDIGRPSRVAGLRELSVRRAPYVLVYRMDGSAIEIVALYHTAQDR